MRYRAIGIVLSLCVFLWVYSSAAVAIKDSIHLLVTTKAVEAAENEAVTPVGEWTAQKDGGCKAWNPNPKPNEYFTWTGGCKDGYLEGQGVLQWVVDEKPGTKLEGAYLKGKRNGRFIVSGTDTNGVTRQTDGNYLEDKLNGKVITKWSNGTIFEDEYVNGKLTGKVIRKYSTGASFEGNYLNGKPNGKGIRVEANGRRYEGNWEDGEKSGLGVETGTISDGSSFRYEGEFFKNKPHGRGKISWSPGGSFEGEWAEGRIKKGVYLYIGGNRYEGELENGLPHGQGILTWVNSDRYKYEGTFAAGKPEGQGVLTMADGRIFRSSFANGNYVNP